MERARYSLVALGLLASIGCSPRTRPADVVTCTPGSMIEVGCANGIGRICSGDPEIRVCEGATLPDACVEGATTELAFDDDGGGLTCPNAQLICPTSGRITVVPDGPGSWVCGWEVAPVPATDRLPATVSCTPGAVLVAGCDGVVGDVCRGDSIIRVCDGTLDVTECIASTSPLATDDDGGAVGYCPLARFTCPSSGRVTVVPSGYQMRPPSDWDCRWDVGAPSI